ncbi:MAG: peptidase M28, partial [Terracidiphilus sp.]
MKTSRVVAFFAAILFLTLPLLASAQKKPVQAAAESAPASVQAQPAHESLDLTMYARIREEGLAHSRIMEYATGLFDDIGPRLTGSPNLTKAYKWTSEQFTAMGCSNVHLEGWGDFGMGWRQIATSVDMASPDTAVFIAQATPWSPATSGSVHAFVIAIPALHSEKDFDEWKGRLAGKIILYGNTPAINPDPKPLLEHYDAAKLEQIYDYPLNLDFSEQHIAPYSPGEMASMFRRVA